MKLYTIPVFPGLAADGLNIGVNGNSADAPQGFGKYRFFLVELIAVRGMLILAAAAPAEVLALRLDAV